MRKMKGDVRRLDQIWSQLEQVPSVQRLGPPGISYLRSVVYEGASREVGKRALFSNSGSFSMSTGHRVGYESEDGEQAFALLRDFQGVGFVFPQPPAISMAVHDVNGRVQTRPKTPDFLVVKQEEIVIVEVKFLDEIIKKSKKYPADWVRADDGTWRFLPGEKATQSFGLSFQVFYPELLTPQYRANLHYLVRLKQEPPPDMSDRLLSSVRSTLLKRPMSINDLLERFTQITGDQLLVQVMNGRLFGGLNQQTITSDFVLYGSEAQRDEAFSELELYRIRDVSDSEYSEHLIRATVTERHHAEKAIARYQERRDAGVPMNSTDYRHRKLIDAATQTGAPAIAGLIPRFSERGGPGTPVDAKHREFLISKIKEILKEKRGRTSPSGIHTDLETLSNDEWYVPCIETLRRWIAEELTPERLAALTGGPRAIQKARRKTEGACCIERVDLGGMLAHIDAAYGDVVPKDKASWNETRPIVFPILLSGSLYVPAAGILLGRPSSLGLVMALRMCMVKHGFLPCRILEDRGSEFNNNLSKEFSSHFDIDYRQRPISASRTGGDIEGFNAQLNAFLQTLRGGTYFDQKGRDADTKQKGICTAGHTIEEIIHKIFEWIELWNNTRHSSALETPKEIFDREVAQFPDSVRRISFNQNAAYLTSYPIAASRYSYQRGLSFAGKRYASDAASELIHEREKLVDYRLDSTDPSVIWAKSAKGFLRLTANNHRFIEGMGPVQRIVAISEAMRFHRIAKRNQAEFRMAQNKLRKNGTSKCFPAKDRPVEKVAQADAKADAIKRSSFTEMAAYPRARAETIRRESDDAA